MTLQISVFEAIFFLKKPLPYFILHSPKQTLVSQRLPQQSQRLLWRSYFLQVPSYSKIERSFEMIICVRNQSMPYHSKCHCDENSEEYQNQLRIEHFVWNAITHLTFNNSVLAGLLVFYKTHCPATRTKVGDECGLIAMHNRCHSQRLKSKLIAFEVTKAYLKYIFNGFAFDSSWLNSAANSQWVFASMTHWLIGPSIVYFVGWKRFGSKMLLPSFAFWPLEEHFRCKFAFAVGKLSPRDNRLFLATN